MVEGGDVTDMRSRPQSRKGRVCHHVGVSDRLTSLDASFLYLEEPTTVMHVGSVMVFEAPQRGFDYERLVT